MDDHNEFAKVINKAKLECKKAKRAFEKGIAEGSKKSPKVFWNYVNSKLKCNKLVADL